KRGLWPWIFIPIQREPSIIVENRHEAACEMATLNGRRSALLTDQSELIESFTRNALQRRDRIGAHSLLRLRMQLTKMHVPVVEHLRTLIRTTTHGERHHFGSTRDNQILHPGHHGSGGNVDRSDARTAEPVERYAARAHVVACIERRHPA